VSIGRYQSNKLLLTNFSIILLTTNINQLEAQLLCPCRLITHKLQTMHVICTESVSQRTTLYCLGGVKVRKWTTSPVIHCVWLCQYIILQS
jgi:hypothetical protein